MNEADSARAGDPALLSIGHSTHPIQVFVELLRGHAVESVADVRTAPFSRFNPQFNRQALERELHAAGVRYLFLGRELGGRPDGDRFYDQEGHVLYGRMAESPRFEHGLSRLVERAERSRVAFMCSEEDPAGCHRFLLVTRVLLDRGIEVVHIRGQLDTANRGGGHFSRLVGSCLRGRVAPWRVGEKFLEIHSAGGASRRCVRGVTGRCLATSSAAINFAVSIDEGRWLA